MEFYEALSKTEQYSIFEEKSIRKLIEFNFPLVKRYVINKLFKPFLMFQLTLYVYLNFIFQKGEPGSIEKLLDLPAQFILGFYSCYFLKNEVVQMKNDGANYLIMFWNYVDIITPTTILTLLFINTFNIKINSEIERSLQAIGVFFMWFKLLYFFRIFQEYGFFIRLII